MDTDHDQVKDLLAAYALGAVPQDEMRAIRAHILSCDECMAEADANSEATMTLGLAVDPVELPAGFADKVMAQVAEERPEPVGAPLKGRARWSPWQALAGVAAFVVIAVLSTALIDARSDLSDTRARLQQAGAPGWDIQGTSALGKIVPTVDGSLMLVAGMGEAPNGRTYQLWMMKGDCLERPEGSCEYTSAGTFDVAGGGMAVVESKLEIANFDGAGITVEPEGGSPQPTAPPLLTTV